MRTHPSSPRGDTTHGREHRLILDHLASWESQDLLTHQQAERIRASEQIEPVAGARVPLIAEVVAYLGATLALAAGVALIGPHWDEITHAWRVVGASALAAIMLAAGWFLRANAEPAVRRLAGVLWTMSVGVAVFAVGLVLFDLPARQDPAPWALFAVGICAAVYAGVLRFVLPCVPLQLALYGATLATVGGAGLWAGDTWWPWLGDNPSWFGIGILVVSAGWIAAGALGRMEPKHAALVIGALGVALAPQFVQEPQGFGLLLGVSVGVALLVASTMLHDVAMLTFGALGLFGYLVGSIVYFLSDSIGVPFALLLSGLVLLGVAVAVMRLRRFTTPGPEGL